MSNKFTGTGTPRDEQFPSKLLVQHPVSSDHPLLFQVFFLAQDQSQSVEIVETTEIDFGEITQRLKSGESVFIKNKNQETLDSGLKQNKEEDHNWYFTHY